jgi:hypothetical protein
MGRRNARSGRGGGGGGFASLTLALESAVRSYLPYSWIEGDTYTIDVATSKPGSFDEKVTAGTGIRAITASHALVQAVSAQQVAVPIASATLNNQLALTFAGAQRYRSNSTGAAWKFLHDGTGAEVFTWYVGPAVGTAQTLIASVSVAGLSTNHGIMMSNFNVAGTETQELRIGNGTGSPVNSNGASGGAAGTAEYANVRFLDGATPAEWMNIFKTSTVTSGNTTPSSSDAMIPLQVGADGANANSSTGVWGGYLIWNRILTAVERANVRAYIATKYGAA